MLYSTATDIADFAAELKRETDRGLPLVAAALIDAKLEEILAAFFCEGRELDGLLDGGNAPLASFSARAQTCFALGLIDDYEFSEINLVRKVRNEFAHARHGLSFSNAKVRGLCATLTSHIPVTPEGDKNDPRYRFVTATMALVLRLYHRPDWVGLERRKAKDWVKDEPRLRRYREQTQAAGVLIEEGMEYIVLHPNQVP
jgi:hypothetical protein